MRLGVQLLLIRSWKWCSCLQKQVKDSPSHNESYGRDRSEFDTHKLGVEKNSESTVHTLYKEDLADDMFEFNFENSPKCAVDAMRATQKALAELQKQFVAETDPKKKNYYRRLMKQILPESFIQRRFVCMNYEALRHMYAERKDHRLPEWNKVFVDWVKTLPYNEFITNDFDDKEN